MEDRTYPEIFFSTHRVSITIRDKWIHCFKYNNDQCTYEIFENLEEAQEWIIQPFPDMVYKLVFN
jgi:hypothetical protein